MLGKVTMQANVAHDLARIVARRIGQQDLPARQPRQQPLYAALGADHPRQVVEPVRIAQEVIGTHAVMADHAQQRRAIALPVGDTHGVDGFGMGRKGLVGQHPRDQRVHVGVNGREDRVRRVVQRIVEIEQPDEAAGRAGRSDVTQRCGPV